jgi:putative mRNA 3-end processing factor
MLITVNKFGIYCPQADVYIDPWRAVDKAIITHAHSDHARSGSKHYLCHTLTVPLLKIRLGKKISVEGKAYGETFYINGVQFSLHAAGHVIGSAQIRVAYKSEVWVISGDYKLQNDGVSGEFETVKCNHFVTESTFGLPIYHFQEPADMDDQLDKWIAENNSNGLNSVFYGYSLGKAQRLANLLLPKYPNQFVAHPSIVAVHNALHEMNALALPIKELEANDLPKIILVPPAASNIWLQQFGAYKSALCSGWMQLRVRRYKSIDKGFAISDHADWAQLNKAIVDTGAENIYVTHGYSTVLAKWVQEHYGLNAVVLETLFHASHEGDAMLTPEFF